MFQSHFQSALHQGWNVWCWLTPGQDLNCTWVGGLRLKCFVLFSSESWKQYNMEGSLCLTLWIIVKFISYSCCWPPAHLQCRRRPASHFWHKSLCCHKDFCPNQRGGVVVVLGQESGEMGRRKWGCEGANEWGVGCGWNKEMGKQRCG